MLLNGTFLANLLATFTLLAQSNGAPVDGSPWDGPLDFPTPYKPVSELVGAKSTMHPVQLDFTIHPSCNVKQTQNLRHAFVELRKVATAASTYIQTHGPKDPLIIKYFGRISPADIKVARATFNRIAQVRSILFGERMMMLKRSFVSNPFIFNSSGRQDWSHLPL